MLIVLDANIWISERLLRSGSGAAFLHATRRMGHRILLPDVTRDEIIAGIERQGASAVQKIDAGFATIQALTGSRPEYRLPSLDDFHRGAEHRIEELSDLLLHVVVESRHHDRALARLHQHRPPAETKEQYRDCLLWELLLDQRQAQNVLLTADKDFSDRQSPSKGLADSLRRECSSTVVLYATLADYLKKTEPQLPPIEMKPILAAIADQVLPVALALAQERGFDLAELRESSVELFATEKADALAAVFTLTFSVRNLPLSDGSSVDEADLLFSGDCIMKTSTSEIAEFAMGRIAARDMSGKSVPFGILYGSGSVVIGVRSIPYRARVPIKSSDA